MGLVSFCISGMFCVNSEKTSSLAQYCAGIGLLAFGAKVWSMLLLKEPEEHGLQETPAIAWGVLLPVLGFAILYGMPSPATAPAKSEMPEIVGTMFKIWSMMC